MPLFNPSVRAVLLVAIVFARLSSIRGMPDCSASGQSTCRAPASAGHSIPVVDVSPWIAQFFSRSEGGNEDEAYAYVDESIAVQLDTAFSEYGFAVVTGHGVKPQIFDDVYHKGREFFRSPLSDKSKYDPGLGYGYGGYLNSGHETGGQLTGVSTGGKADLVESLTCRGLQHVTSRNQSAHGEGMESAKNPYFAQDMSDTPRADTIPDALLQPTLALHKSLFPFKNLLLRTTEYTLGLGKFELETSFDPARGGIRLPYYPPLSDFSSNKTLGYGAHADSGGMVILRLDRENPTGTEVLYQNEWIPIPTAAEVGDDAIVLNGGTVLQRLTGGRWRAAIHRATRVNGAERLSIVYGAMVPSNDLEISSLAFKDLHQAGGRNQTDAASAMKVRVKDYLDARVRLQRPETDPRDKELLDWLDNM